MPELLRTDHFDWQNVNFTQQKNYSSMMKNSDIVKASMVHLPILVDFALDMAMETEQRQLDQDTIRQAWIHLLSNPTDSINQDGIVLLKTVNGEPVGVTRLYSEGQNATWLTAVYVKPQHRGQGHFKSLFFEAVRLSRQHGFKHLKLNVFNQNQNAKNTYQKLGMKPTQDQQYLYEFDLQKQPEPEQGRFQAVPIKHSEEADSWCKGRKNLLNGQLFEEVGWKQGLKIVKDGQRVGYLRYYYFFDNWENGVTPFIREVYLDSSLKWALPEVVQAAVESLRVKFKLKVVAAHCLFRGPCQLMGGEVQPYEIYSLALQ